MPHNGVPPAATTLVKRAAAALTLSRTQSRCVHEAGALNTSPPKRTTHEPLPVEREARVPNATSHDQSPRLKYRTQVSQWGIV